MTVPSFIKTKHLACAHACSCSSQRDTGTRNQTQTKQLLSFACRIMNPFTQLSRCQVADSIGSIFECGMCLCCRSSSNGTAAPLHPELVSKPRRRTGDPDNELTHPLLGDEPTLQLMPNRNDVVGIGGRREKKKGFLDWWFSSRPKPMRVSNTTPRLVMSSWGETPLQQTACSVLSL